MRALGRVCAFLCGGSVRVERVARHATFLPCRDASFESYLGGSVGLASQRCTLPLSFFIKFPLVFLKVDASLSFDAVLAEHRAGGRPPVEELPRRDGPPEDGTPRADRAYAEVS